MPISTSIIERRLTTAQVAIDNARSTPGLLERLSEYGYDAAQLQQGRALYERTRTLHQQRQHARGDRITAADARAAAWQQGKATYRRHVKLARVAFKTERGVLEKLGLHGSRKHTLSGWLTQAGNFYRTALDDDDILARLARYGLTQARLEAGLAEVRAVEAANLAQKQGRGDARLATKACEAASSELNAWMRDFIVVARVALDDQPHLLDKLGLRR